MDYYGSLHLQRAWQPWYPAPHNSAAPEMLPSEGTGGTPPWFCPFEASYHFIKGWCLVQPCSVSSRGFVLCSAMASDTAFVLHWVFFLLMEGTPFQAYQPFNNFSYSHCPKYTKEKIPPIATAMRHKCKTRWHMLNKEPRKGQLFFCLCTQREEMTEGKIFSNASHGYSVSVEVFILGCMCLQNAHQIRRAPLL